MSLFNLQLFVLYFCLHGIFLVTTKAFNITEILNQHSDFSSFNTYLTQTGVANSINDRQTITVLALDNGAASSLSSQSMVVIRDVLSLHVILDFYDEPKLRQLQNKTAILTTLFQASGLASGQQGFINVTDLSRGIAFGSAVPGSSLGSNLVNSIYTEPYNLSVLQISGAVVPPGIGSSTNWTTSPSPSQTLAPIGNPPKSSESPATSPVVNPTPPMNKAPAPSTNAYPPTTGGNKAPTPSNTIPVIPVIPVTNVTSPPPAGNAHSPFIGTPPSGATSPFSGGVASSPTGASPTGAPSIANGPVADGPGGAYTPNADAPTGDSPKDKSAAISVNSEYVVSLAVAFLVTSLIYLAMLA